MNSVQVYEGSGYPVEGTELFCLWVENRINAGLGGYVANNKRTQTRSNDKSDFKDAGTFPLLEVEEIIRDWQSIDPYWTFSRLRVLS